MNHKTIWKEGIKPLSLSQTEKKDEKVDILIIGGGIAGMTALYQLSNVKKNILLIDKKVGMVVHADDEGSSDCLINHIKSYLYKKGEYNPVDENTFVPSLCNRLDRNTGGIVIAAKNAEALRIMNQKVKDREMKKIYLWLLEGLAQIMSALVSA